MSSELTRILNFAIYLPLYLTALVGLGLVLRLRRTAPRACWYAIAAFAVLGLNWFTAAISQLKAESAYDWSNEVGLDPQLLFLGINVVLALLQTVAAALVIAAILTGRETRP